MDNVFSVNAQNGEVSVVQPLDFETTPSFRLWLQAEDRVSGLAAFTELSIVVTDVNDNSPICKQLVNIALTLPIIFIFLVCFKKSYLFYICILFSSVMRINFKVGGAILFKYKA